MLTYEQHYNICRQLYDGKVDFSKYGSVYDLTVDETFLELDGKYHEIVNELSKKISFKLDNNIGCFSDDYALRVNDWRDIEEINQIANIVMPQIEQKVFHCNLNVEFVHPYRNLHKIPDPVSSWLWHYDDCPKEFIKLFLYLNDVDEKNGCLQLLKLEKGFETIKSSRIGPQNNGRPQLKQQYANSRIPAEVVEKSIDSGGEIYNLIGSKGKYALFTPNVPHRATVPQEHTIPRDVIVFFIRPSLTKKDSYISKNTGSYLPKRNVKLYQLD